MPAFIRLIDTPASPWKNGGGVTQELFKIPSSHLNEFKLRISIAQVDKDCDFSLFPGVSRSLLLLHGTSMNLEFANGRREIIEPLKNIVHFRGEEPLMAKLLHGPCIDFNLMTRDNPYVIELHHFRKNDSSKIVGVADSFIYQAKGTVSLGRSQIQAETLWLISEEKLKLTFLEDTTLIFISPGKNAP